MVTLLVPGLVCVPCRCFEFGRAIQGVQFDSCEKSDGGLIKAFHCYGDLLSINAKTRRDTMAPVCWGREPRQPIAAYNRPNDDRPNQCGSEDLKSLPTHSKSVKISLRHKEANNVKYIFSFESPPAGKGMFPTPLDAKKFNTIMITAGNARA